MIIYYLFQESPLTHLTSFLHRCIRKYTFDAETIKLLSSFLQICQRKYSIGSSSPWQLSKESMQKAAVALVRVALAQNFDSAFHQREFLKCLAEAQFEKNLMGKITFIE